MLAKARRRVERQHLAQVDSLLEMDAENMAFEDSSFDSVLALYVASVVPNPAKFVAEMKRVCVPGGTIVIVNHFMSDNPAMRWVERRLAPLAGRIGFHADFPLEPFIESGKLDVREVRPSNLFGYWKLLRCTNNKLPNE
jgi:phosphatidylethanolamine/phosphatidyl-N-methylethanolamine N-methyltransferase